MAKTSTLGITVSVTGDGVVESLGQAPNVLQIVNSNCPGALPVNYALAAGLNTIPVPPGAVALLIVPPTGSVNSKILKGITGDTGFSMNPALPGVYPFAGGTPNVLITSGGVETIQIGWL